MPLLVCQDRRELWTFCWSATVNYSYSQAECSHEIGVCQRIRRHPLKINQAATTHLPSLFAPQVVICTRVQHYAESTTAGRLVPNETETHLKCPFVQGLFSATTVSASAKAADHWFAKAKAAERLHNAIAVSSLDTAAISHGGRDRAISAERE